jgi:hypothetical protein
MRKRSDYRDVFAGEPCSVVSLKDRKSGENFEVASFVSGRHYAGNFGKLGAKYVLRHIVQRLFTYESFSKLLERYAAPVLRLRWSLKPLLPGKLKQLLDSVLPVYDYRETHPLTADQLIERGKLDTLDAFFARFDTPMTPEAVLCALRKMGVLVLSVDRRLNFFRTRLPAAAPDTDRTLCLRAV